MRRLNWIIVPFLFLVVVFVAAAMAVYESVVLGGGGKEAWEYAKDVAFCRQKGTNDE